MRNIFLKSTIGFPGPWLSPAGLLPLQPFGGVTCLNNGVTSMKTVLCLFTGIILLGCESRVLEPVHYSLGEIISSPQNASVLVTDPQGLITTFSVTILTIVDSRCPSDVECIWAGQATVNFVIEGNAIQMAIGQFKEFDIGTHHLKITLTNVTPIPTSSNGAKKRTAFFIVDRL
jgi:hypothetical protein